MRALFLAMIACALTADNAAAVTIYVDRDVHDTFVTVFVMMTVLGILLGGVAEAISVARKFRRFGTFLVGAVIGGYLGAFAGLFVTLLFPWLDWLSSLGVVARWTGPVSVGIVGNLALMAVQAFSPPEEKTSVKRRQRVR